MEWLCVLFRKVKSKRAGVPAPHRQRRYFPYFTNGASPVKTRLPRFVPYLFTSRTTTPAPIRKLFSRLSIPFGSFVLRYSA